MNIVDLEVLADSPAARPDVRTSGGACACARASLCSWRVLSARCDPLYDATTRSSVTPWRRSRPAWAPWTCCASSGSWVAAVTATRRFADRSRACPRASWTESFANSCDAVAAGARSSESDVRLGRPPPPAPLCTRRRARSPCSRRCCALVTGMMRRAGRQPGRASRPTQLRDAGSRFQAIDTIEIAPAEARS